MTHFAPPFVTRRRRGAALLTAMVIVVLVATLASAMVWQQWRAVQVEAAERARAQSAWLLNGLIDWARLILREDARTNQRITDLTAPWATPLAEARLSSFLAADKDNADDGPAAFLSGGITDAQAKYNLRNLLEGDKVAPAELVLLQRLFSSIGVAPALATLIAEGLRDAEAGNGTGVGAAVEAPLTPQRLSQLTWLGVDAASIARMQPFVVLLPSARTTVNLNTAPREVLASLIDGLDLAGAERLRLRAPFKAVDEAERVLGGRPLSLVEKARLGVASNYFELRGRLRVDDRVLEENALVQRTGNDVLVLQRERASGQDLGG